VLRPATFTARETPEIISLTWKYSKRKDNTFPTPENVSSKKYFNPNPPAEDLLLIVEFC